MNISRRYFLKNGGVAMLGMAALPSFLQRAVAGTPTPNQKKMVVLFQRGAMDGLNVVVPFGETNYYRMRPTIAISQPRLGGTDAALDLDGFFGLHPSLAPMLPLFRNGPLAIVQAVESRTWFLAAGSARSLIRKLDRSLRANERGYFCTR